GRGAGATARGAALGGKPGAPPPGGSGGRPGPPTLVDRGRPSRRRRRIMPSRDTRAREELSPAIRSTRARRFDSLRRGDAAPPAARERARTLTIASHLRYAAPHAKLARSAGARPRRPGDRIRSACLLSRLYPQLRRAAAGLLAARGRGGIDP